VLSNSVETIRHYLHLQASGVQPVNADGLLTEHVAELHRRIESFRMSDAGIEVRVSPAVDALQCSTEAYQEIGG